MLGLWETGTMPITLSQHVAFEVSLPDLHKAPERLRQAGIEARDFAGQLTEEPVVLAWMPAASVYFHDPDGNFLEFITMLPDGPRPDLGVLPWSKWLYRMPTHGSSMSKKRFTFLKPEHLRMNYLSAVRMHRHARQPGS